MSDFEIMDRDAKIDTWYNVESLLVTKKEITALLSGEKLYSTIRGGEYAITLEMVESKE